MLSSGRWISIVIGLLLVLLGSVFALQGVGVIPGSFMSHNSTWTYVGGAMVFVGLLLLVFMNRSPSVQSSTTVSPSMDSKS